MEDERSFRETTTPTNPKVLLGSWAGRSSSAICCSAPRSSSCRCRRLSKSQMCSLRPYFPASSNSGLRPSFTIFGVPHSEVFMMSCPTTHVRVWVLRAEARTTSVPDEVRQLIIVARKIHLADDLAISGRMQIDINYAYGVAFPILADVQQRDVSDVFRRGLHCHAGRGVKGWIRHQGHIHILLLQK